MEKEVSDVSKEVHTSPHLKSTEKSLFAVSQSTPLATPKEFSWPEPVVDGDKIELPKVIPIHKRKTASRDSQKQIEEDTSPTWQRLLFFILLIAATGGVVWLKKINVDYFWYEPFTNTYSLLVVGFIFSRFLFSFLDLRRLTPLPLPSELPAVSIVIPAKNEEKAIYRTIENAFQADYPKNKLQVIAVNDGSSDGTLKEMIRAKNNFQDLRIINFTVNRGKRHCMAAAAQTAIGDIITFVDSDSFIRRDAIKKIIRPFMNRKVAAATGRTDVENWNHNFLTKMQAFRYYIAFKLIKAAESLFGSVTCCPGCFSAYRKDALQTILGLWLRQKFLGTVATFGDDRSLTTYLLRKNFKIVYVDTALCTTIVPEGWMHYLKQQARWKKSWIRETLIASVFMWRKHPLMAASFYVAAIFPFVTPIVTFNNVIYNPIFKDQFPLFYAAGLLLMCSVFALYYRFKRNDGLWFHGFVYSVFYVLFLVWQMPYAILTLRKNEWGTR